MLRSMLERYSKGSADLSGVKSVVEEIVERWRNAPPEGRPEFDPLESRLWHVVWQIEFACHEQLAPDGIAPLAKYLTGELEVPVGGPSSRP